MYTKTTWTDKAIQYPQRYYLNTDGGNDKNLIPPFTDWTLHANAVATLPYTLTLTATASTQVSTVKIPIIGGSNYTVSRSNTSGYYAYRWYDINNSVLTSYVFALSDGSGTSATITAPSNAVYIEVALYNNTTIATFTFTNPQLELGSSATSFTPKKLYTIKQSNGTVTQAGTAVNATTLNNIEQGIFNNLILSIMGAI